MAKNRRAQVEVAVGADTSGAKTSVEDLKKSIAGIGDAGQKSGESVDRATGKMIASFQRAQAATESFGKARSDQLESLARIRGANMQVLDPYIAQLRAAEAAQLAANASLQKGAVVFNQYGLSAKQTAAALRQVPAQLTDIFVSLQGGQAPLTVLLQQGGQLKDIFGGIVPAAKALGSALLGLVNPYTVAAAAIGGLAYAYNKGASESQAFEKAVITSGRAAGVTGGQLSDMAKAIERIGGGSQSKAAEVLTKMAASGKIGAENMQRYGAAIVEFDRVGGGVAEKTIGAFEELAKAPLQASLKLNDAMNYLSRSTIDTIKSLEEQGRTVEAATVASDAYYESIRGQTPELERNLGSMERGWRAIKEAIGGVVSAAANIGRESSLNDAINVTQASVDRLRAAAENRAVANPREFAKFLGGQSFSAQADELQVVLDKLRAGAALQEQLSAATAEQAKNTRDYGAHLKENEKYLANSVKLNKEITRITVDGLRFGESMEEIQRKIALARERMAKSGSGSKAESRELEQQARLINELSGVTQDFTEDLLRLNRVRQDGTITEERYQVLLRELLAKQPVFKELAKQQADAEKERAKALKEANDAQTKNLAGLDKQIEGNEKTLDGLREELIGITMGKQARAEAITQRYEEAAAQAEQNAQLAYMGDFNEYEKLMKIAEGLRAVAAERRKITSATTMKEIEEANEKAAKKAQDEWEKASDQIGQSLADSLMEGGKSAAEYIKDLFRTMVLRPIIQAVVQPVANGVNSTINTIGQYANLYNAFSSGLSGGAGWASGLGASVFGSPYAYGAAIGTTNVGVGSQAWMLAQQTGQFGLAGTTATSSAAAGAGSGAASWASWATTWGAAIAAGIYKANQDWNEGFRRDQAKDFANEIGGGGKYIIGSGGLESEWANALSKMGFSDKLADLFSGSTAVAALFGRAAPRITGQGIQGTIGAGDFTGQAYADIYEKGGLFRSSKSYQQFAALPEEVGRFLDGAAKGIFDKAKEYGDALGLPVESLASITADLKVQIGDDAEKNKEEILKALGGYGDALVAGWTEALKPLAMYGETVTQTIERVGAAILGVNGVLEMIGKTALAASIDGGKAAIALTDLFGGAENLIRATTGYYEAYFSEAEKAARSTQLVTDALAEVGIAMPDSRAAFRELVEGLDLTTAAGREQFAVMMKVSDAFAQLNPLAEELAGNLDGLKDSMDELEDLVNGLEDILGITAKSIQEVLAEMIEGQQRLQGFRAGLQDDIRQYTLAGMSPADRIAALKAREEQLFAALPDATDPVAVAEQLTGVILDRVQEEAALRQQVDADHLDALREQLTSLERMQDLSQRLAQFTASLRSSDLSPLSYRDQLNAAGSLFDTTLAQAQAGDLMAQQNLQGNAQAYLQEARAFFGSNKDYANIFARVTSGLDSVGGASVDPQIQAIRDQVAALEALGNSAGDMAESSIAIAEALTRVDGILDVREDQEAARIAAQTQLALDQIAELAKIVEAEKDTAGAVALGNVKIVEQLVYLSGRIDRLLENAQLEATAP